MIIAIGSTRKPKVEAVKSIFRHLADELLPQGDRMDFRPVAADSGIGAMPLSLHELMQGARNRALDARRKIQNAETSFSVGLEGGFFRTEAAASEPGYFLQSWVYVWSEGGGSFGCSAAVPVPQAVVRAVVEGGVELGEVIDDFAGKVGVRDHGGAFEVFTAGRIHRKQSYEMALICALAPFYNRRLYRQSG